MYNQRYCEYLMVHFDAKQKLIGDVWNTFGLNKCPAAWWKASDANALKTEFGALVVKLNGPRYWLIDSASIVLDKAQDPRVGSVRSFSGNKMRFLTNVDVPITNGKPGLSAYTETVVNRTTHFSFSRRYPLHELISPAGKRYAMQAYSQIVDPTLTLAKLRGLKPQLELPAGWRYNTRRLKANLTLVTKGKTTVVQDRLENTYQLIK